MSSQQPTQTQALLQELKSNRRTQAALLAFVVMVAWLFWPDSKPIRKGVPGVRGSGQQIDNHEVAALRKLPNLSGLDQAGELPKENDVYRDPFLFEAPKPPPRPVPPPPPPPPPPPKTPEQIAAEELQASKNLAMNTKPSQLRYIGFLKGKPSGLVGAFMKGEEPVTVPVGSDLSGWKLVSVDDKKASFQNLKYQDLRFDLDAKDAGGAATPDIY